MNKLTENLYSRSSPILLLCITCLAPLSLNRMFAAEVPNIVFVIADDLTFRDIGCYGGQAKTPNIDRLASEGMQFSRCFQSAPMCSPTRHNIYTGLYPVRSGAYPNHTFAKAGTKSVVHYLRPLGYRVALSGKTHIGPKEVFPFEYSGGKNPDMDAIEQLIVECKRENQPFCLFACSNEPHSPWNKGDASQYPAAEVQLPPYIVDTPLVRENFSRYLAEVSYYDQQVGQIVELLNKHNIQENTLLIVVSEQGNSFPFAKWTCYDHGLQSAMLVRWPGKIEAGSRSDAMVEYTDILPTMIEAAGAPPVDDLDGSSFLGVLTGDVQQHKAYSFSEMTTRGIINGSPAYAIRSVRGPRYRLIWNLNHENEFTNACTQSDYYRSMVELANSGNTTAAELVHKYQFRPEYELYDCEQDPNQLQNLIDEEELKPVASALKAELEAWMQRQGDLGIETEMRALLRQGRYRDMTLAEADAAWQARQN